MRINCSVKTCGCEGSIETVVDAMCTHISNPDVCENGCGALWNMTVNNGKRSLSCTMKQQTNGR